ncbi:MAG: hypothetical protein L0H64_11390 [Pseudonocardia sp.]|nr:hypothetical protein [Pseudonocardia sp.]
MLKKAGIVVAAAAAGLLAVSPLAFAGDTGHDHHGHDGDNTVNSVNDDSENSGLVNVADNEVNVPVQACNNDVPVNVLGIQVTDVQADLTGALGLLSDDTSASDEGSAGDVRECTQENSSGGSIVQSIDD